MKFFKGKNKQAKLVEQQQPRSMDDINKEYTDLIGKLGIEQLKITVSTKNAEQYANRLLQVNAEANARTELDNKAKLEEPKEVQGE